MLETLLSKLGAILLAPILFFTSVFAPVPTQAPDDLGVALPSATALFETSLAAPITNTATTMTITSNSVRGGGSLSGYQCFTIDEGSAQAEYVCGTVTTTTVSSLERGISPADGTTEDTDLQFSHRRGASVKITDFPLLQRLKSQASGGGTYEAVLQYANGVTPSGGSDLVDVEYLTSVVTGTSTLSYNRIVVQGTAGETLATGNIVYLSPADQRWYKADNDDQSTYVNRTLGVAQSAGTSGSAISSGVLTYGLDTTQVGMTAGAYYFLSSTAGGTSTATTSQPLGQARSTTQLFFDPGIITGSVYVPTTFTATTTFTGRAAGVPRVTDYTSSTTYTKPTGLSFIQLEMWGAGGGGGGGAAAGGGGGGAYASFRIDADNLTATSAIIIGTGGASGAVGGSTYFTFATSTLIAFGGATNGGNGGGAMTHGTSSEANISAYFQGIAIASPVNPQVATTTILGGGAGGTQNGSNYASPGGSSIFGGGGGGALRTAGAVYQPGGSSAMAGRGGSALNAATGEDGLSPGGGGGAGTTNGGRGANGMVRITEYF